MLSTLGTGTEHLYKHTVVLFSIVLTVLLALQNAISTLRLKW